MVHQDSLSWWTVTCSTSPPAATLATTWGRMRLLRFFICFEDFKLIFQGFEASVWPGRWLRSRGRPSFSAWSEPPRRWPPPQERAFQNLYWPPPQQNTQHFKIYIEGHLFFLTLLTSKHERRPTVSTKSVSGATWEKGNLSNFALSRGKCF